MAILLKFQEESKRMNRADIVARMALREKEIFEKYKDIYPFPTRKFVEEIGIKIIEEDEKNGQQLAILTKEKNGKYQISITKTATHKDFGVCIKLMEYIFSKFAYKAQDIELSLLFLVTKEEFSKTMIKYSIKSKLGKKKIAKHFGIPTSSVDFYREDYFEF